MYVVSTVLTKHCDRIHSNRALYSSGPELTMVPGVPAIMRFFVTVLNSTQILGQYCKLRCVCFPPPPS